jgi:hypothetical protein
VNHGHGDVGASASSVVVCRLHRSLARNQSSQAGQKSICSNFCMQRVGVAPIWCGDDGWREVHFV